MNNNIDKIMDLIKEMNVSEINDLVKAIEKEFDVSAASISVGSSPSGETDSASKSDAKSEVDLVLKSFGGNKVSVIKIVKEITGLGLMDAKKMVESAPATVKEKISPESAKEISEKLIAAGAEVEIK